MTEKAFPGGGMRGSLAKKGAKKFLKGLREGKDILYTNTGPRDTGQSDYKNRFTINDLSRLVPIYNGTGYFSVEVHGGARLHQDLLNNQIEPFEDGRQQVNQIGGCDHFTIQSSRVTRKDGENGRGGEIRTHDLLYPKQAR